MERVVYVDRLDAGIQLGEALKGMETQETVVVALPRGGVVVGYEVAKVLKVPLEIVCPRKIGAPGNPEYAIGAITETGTALLQEEVISNLSVTDSYLKKAMDKEQLEAIKRLQIFREGRPPRNLKGKRVILVDDGLATGFTMKAALATCREEGAAEVIVAVPVGPVDTCDEIRMLADKLICLQTPPQFYAIGQFYEEFLPTSDKEVILLMKAKTST